jgi:hypothetical protein
VYLSPADRLVASTQRALLAENLKHDCLCRPGRVPGSLCAAVRENRDVAELAREMEVDLVRAQGRPAVDRHE